jgi:hypothetical protein
MAGGSKGTGRVRCFEALTFTSDPPRENEAAN